MIDDRHASAAALTVVLCFLGSLCEGFDVQAAGVAAGGLIHDFHPSPHTLGLFFSASGAGLLVGALVGGYAADRIGRKTVLVASLGTFGIFSLLTSVAPDLPSLIGARLFTGFGLGAAMPNLIALAVDASTSRSRNSSIAAAYAGMPLGAVAASLVTFVVPLEAWRQVFQVGGIAPLMLLPLVVLCLPRPEPTAAAVARQAFSQDEVPRVLFGEGRTFTTLLLWASFFLIVLTLHLMVNWLPILLVGRGLPRGHAALAQAGFNVGGAVAALCVGKLLDSGWRRYAIIGSLSILPVVLCMIAVSPAGSGLLVALTVLLGSAILAAQVIAYAVASACYPAAARGTGVGAAVAAGRLGSLAGPLFAASLLAAGRSPSQVFIGLLPIVVVCGSVIGYLAWRELRLEVPPGSEASNTLHCREPVAGG